MSGDPDPERIRRFGARILRDRAEPLEAGGPQARALLDRLWRILSADGGVGLAAPQIGVSRRAVVIRDPQQEPDRQRLDLVNPVLVETFGPAEVFEEGCLSFPGLFFNVERPRGAVIEYRDAEGTEHRLRDESLVARIAQHEMDHLDGVLFIDRVPALRRIWLWPRLALIALGGWLTGGRSAR